MYPLSILTLLFMAVGGVRLINWWTERQRRAERVAELQAVALNTRPILMRSRFVGDTQVEADAQYLRELLDEAGGILTGADVRVAVYVGSAVQGKVWVDFETWVAHTEEQHRQYVAGWVADQQARRDRQFTAQGQEMFTGQKNAFTWTT